MNRSYNSLDIDSTKSTQSLDPGKHNTTKQDELSYTTTLADCVIVILSGFTFCVSYIFRASISPIMDVLEREFRVTSSAIGQMSSLYYVSYTIMQFPVGFCLEIFAAEFIILVGVIGFAVTVFLFALSTKVLYASIIMFISGIFGSCAWLSLLSIIAQRMGNNQVPLWCGITLFYTYFSLLPINALQAYLWDEHQIWRQLFYVLGAICVLIGIVLFVVSKCSKRKTQPTLLAIADIKQSTQSFAIWRERDGSSSKLDSGLIKKALCNPWNYVLGIYIFCVNAIVNGFTGLWLIPFFMDKYGYERPLATVVNNSFYVSSAFGSLIIGKLSTKYKKRKIFMVVSAVMMTGSAIIVYLPSDTNMSIIVVLNCVSGFGAGIFGVAFTVIREYNEYYKCADVAGAIGNTMTNSSGFLFQAMIGYLLDIHWMNREGHIHDESGKRIYASTDYEFAFICIQIAIGLAIFLSLIIKETNGQTVQFKGK